MKEDFRIHFLTHKFPWILFIILLSTMLSLVACQPAPLPNTGNSQPQNQASSQTINLANISFNPKETTIKAGTTVIWMNKDNMAHTVTADDKSFDSGNLNPGDTFKFTFAKAGTYHFYCRYHGGPNGQGMSGTIVVTGQ